MRGCSSAQLADHALHAFHHARHLLRVDLIGCVARPVVVRITEWRRIGDHHGLESVLREGPMIRPTDAGHKPGATPPMVGKAVCERNDRIVFRTSAREPNMPTNATKSPRSGNIRPNGAG